MRSIQIKHHFHSPSPSPKALLCIRHHCTAETTPVHCYYHHTHAILAPLCPLPHAHCLAHPLFPTQFPACLPPYTGTLQLGHFVCRTGWLGGTGLVGTGWRLVSLVPSPPGLNFTPPHTDTLPHPPPPPPRVCLPAATAFAYAPRACACTHTCMAYMVDGRRTAAV